MLENANETIDLATEDIKERKQVQSQRDEWRPQRNSVCRVREILSLC